MEFLKSFHLSIFFFFAFFASIGFLTYAGLNFFGFNVWDRWKAYSIWGIWPRCEHCKRFWGLRLEDGRTMYITDLKWNDYKNPNRCQLLCRECAEYHHEYWDSMWNDYNSGRL